MICSCYISRVICMGLSITLTIEPQINIPLSGPLHAQKCAFKLHTPIIVNGVKIRPCLESTHSSSALLKAMHVSIYVLF